MKTTVLILLAGALALAAATSARLVIILLAIGLAVAVAARCTLFSSHRVRRMRWRIMARLRPGPGFATLAELTVRWSRLAALRHGRRARPSMRLHHRITSRPRPPSGQATSRPPIPALSRSASGRSRGCSPTRSPSRNLTATPSAGFTGGAATKPDPAGSTNMHACSATTRWSASYWRLPY